MKRKIREESNVILEGIMEESLEKIGVQTTSEKSALLLRIFISGVARHFYFSPDTVIKLGFLEFVKNPEIKELFTVNIIHSEKDSITNADTLWRYYSGELTEKEELKEMLNSFIDELLEYSQSKEVSIMNLTKNISEEQIKKEGGKKNGV